MARYEVLRRSYLVPAGDGADGGPRIIDKGQKVELADDVLPGSSLRPLDAAAKAAAGRKKQLDAERKALREKEAAAKLAAALAGARAA